MRVYQKNRAHEALSVVRNFVYQHERKPDRAAAREKVVARFKKYAKITVERQQIERWLNPNIQRFTPPSLGIGLLLIKIGEELTGEKPKG